jgi:hydrogenase expression/formation protein HypE
MIDELVAQTERSSVALACPTPTRRYETVVMGHGSGGQMTRVLIDEVFAPAFGMSGILSDGAILPELHGRLATSTDSFVVKPTFFPGGNVGSLAVHGTVNDLAVSGARPLYLTAGFILEEGFPIADLIRVVTSMADAAQEAGIQIVAGDTKVVERGHGDGVYINTSGVGVLEVEPAPSPERLHPGDVLIVNGTLGDHGMAVMNARHDLGLESDIQSDSASLNGLIQDVRNVSDIHTMRDLTRGGLSAAVCEIASDTGLGIEIVEHAVPIRPAVATACEILGMDPMQVANEGKLVMAVSETDAACALTAMKSHPLGKESAMIGVVKEDHPGTVVGRTEIGGQRVIDMPLGELLPRIC